MLSIFLGALLLAAPILGVASEGNLSRPGSQHNKVESSADILSFLIGEELCKEEREYLDSLSGEDIPHLIYDNGIPSSMFSVIFDFENGELSFYAKPYSYLTEDMREVTWIPTVARAGGKSAPLTLLPEGTYFATLSEIDGYTDGTAEVEYTLDITVTPDFAASLVNRAYNDAPVIKEAHRLACRNYEEAVKAYGEYLEELSVYNEKLALYERYMTEYTEYTELLFAYNSYLEDLSEYEQQSAAYNAYLTALSEYEKKCLEYAEYLNLYKIYSSEYERYRAYISAVTPYRNQLAAVELTNLKLTHLKRSARSAINGGTVDTVLENRDTLESPIVNAPSAVIDMAGDATERVRVLMDDYFALETEEARYAYYAAYYEDFRDNFVNLFISLDYLYRIGPIRAAIYEQERDEKYRILLAELYYIATSLSDTPVLSVPKEMVEGTNGAEGYKQFTYTPSYLTADGYNLMEILSVKPIEDTDKAEPYDAAFPSEVKEPIAPDPVSEPQKPDAVQPPSKVVEVENPGEPPEPVSNPGNAPTAVPEPGNEPTLTPEQINLIEAYEAGKLSFCNEEFTNNLNYTVVRSVKKQFVNPTFVTVTFTDRDGGELYSVTVDSGSVVLYEAELPTREEDERASYEFVGWADSDGNAVSLDAVVSDLRLYPVFREHLKKYEVLVIVDGEERRHEVCYGDAPPLPTSPVKAEDELRKYPFLGWDKEISAVTENTVYTAVFGSEYLIPMSGGGAKLTFPDGVPTADYSAGLDSDFLVTELLARAYLKSGARLVTRYAVIDVPYLTVKELSEKGAARIKLSVTEGLGSYSYSLLAFDGEGRSLSVSREIKITLPQSLEYNDRLRLYTVSDDGVRNYMRFAVEDDALSFSPFFGESYVHEYEYRIVAPSSELVSIKLDGTAFSIGSSVGVDVELAKGLKLTRLYYRNSQGEETELTSTRFTMPADDIVLYAEVDYVRYKISFVSDGRTVRTLYCIEGELPDTPEPPKMLGEKGYTYTFVGWSPEVSEVTGEAVYTAVFEKAPIPPSESTDSDAPFEWNISYIIVGAALAILAIAGICVVVGLRY